MADKLTEEEIASLRASNDEADWSRVVRVIKSARGGQYPPDWYPRVLAEGGVRDELTVKWGKPNALGVQIRGADLEEKGST